MRRLCSTVLVASLIAASAYAAIPAAGAAGAPTTYYLAVGTSLAVGVQPNVGETTGYVGRVLRNERYRIPGLGLKNVGCPGETSRSMITGEGSLCDYAAGSQLDAAVAFLEAHQGQVAFVTLDVGANDLLERCLRNSGLIAGSCAVDLAPRLERRVARIADELRTAAGSGVPVVGMTYYNPFLGLWVVPGGHALARAGQRAWVVLNSVLASAFGSTGAATADVAATFRIDDFDHTVVLPGFGSLPLNVARTCAWTWFCSERSFGDPHPNAKGYGKIALTFERELRRVLPGPLV
jgi:lysophospholipase L1-like esterase